jgi:hypothetical protein
MIFVFLSKKNKHRLPVVFADVRVLSVSAWAFGGIGHLTVSYNPADLRS